MLGVALGVEVAVLLGVGEDVVVAVHVGLRDEVGLGVLVFPVLGEGVICLLGVLLAVTVGVDDGASILEQLPIENK